MNGLSSRFRDLQQSGAFRLELDNDISFHVARHLYELRHWRGYTQEEVAERMGTTQPKVAAAESGAANLTFRTFRRLLEALGGRLRIAIDPAEVERPPDVPWWSPEVVTCLPHDGGWTVMRQWHGTIRGGGRLHLQASFSPESLEGERAVIEATENASIDAEDWSQFWKFDAPFMLPESAEGTRV